MDCCHQIHVSMLNEQIGFQLPQFLNWLVDRVVLEIKIDGFHQDPERSR